MRRLRTWRPLPKSSNDIAPGEQASGLVESSGVIGRLLHSAARPPTEQDGAWNDAHIDAVLSGTRPCPTAVLLRRSELAQAFGLF